MDIEVCHSRGASVRTRLNNVKPGINSSTAPKVGSRLFINDRGRWGERALLRYVLAARIGDVTIQLSAGKAYQ